MRKIFLLNFLLLSWSAHGQISYSGCTNPSACNYNPNATTENNTCIMPACMDASAANYSPNAICETSNSCVYNNPLCPADLDVNGSIGVSDLLLLLSAQGNIGNNIADVNNDNIVGSLDIVAFIDDYGSICEGSISALNCASVAITGTLISGSAATGVTISIPYTAQSDGHYNGQSITSTETTGLTATLSAGSFTSSGGAITFSIMGTPASSGNANFVIAIGGQTCSLSIAVNPNLPSEPCAGSTAGSSTTACGSSNVHNTNLTYCSMTDQEGNAYKTIIIGTQEWMAENLRTSIYRNGVPITTGLSDSEWQSAMSGSWSYCNNDPILNCPYGKLYNWYAIVDNRNLCPTGWHAPTIQDWGTLLNYIDPTANGGSNQNNIAGSLMKSPAFWSPGSTNSSGMSIIPSGGRNNLGDGTYTGFGSNCNLWSTTIANANEAWLINLNPYYNYAASTTLGKNGGYTVRCVKD